MAEPSEVTRKVHAAYGRLIRDDLELFRVDANERSITHKLAEYLQLEFSEWHVDCEYNRNGGLPKKFFTFVKDVPTDSTEGETIYPDIIVHRRTTSQNLVVIEAKKSTTTARGSDLEKLVAYKSELGYRFAFSVVFPVGRNANSAAAEADIAEIRGE